MCKTKYFMITQRTTSIEYVTHISIVYKSFTKMDPYTEQLLSVILLLCNQYIMQNVHSFIRSTCYLSLVSCKRGVRREKTFFPLRVNILCITNSLVCRLVSRELLRVLNILNVRSRNKKAVSTRCTNYCKFREKSRPVSWDLLMQQMTPAVKMKCRGDLC